MNITIFLLLLAVVQDSFSFQFQVQQHQRSHWKVQSINKLHSSVTSNDKSESPLEVIRTRREAFNRELLSGLVVSLATLPTSVAYSTVVGLSPIVGIWSSVIVGLSVALIAGGPGVIAGAAGVIAIPMAHVVSNHGLNYMGATVILAALMETLFGIFKLGRLANYVSEPVIGGFLNAFALFLLKSQFKWFLAGSTLLPAADLSAALFTSGLCAAIIKLAPRFNKKLPPSLIGLTVSSCIAHALHLPLKTLGDVSGKGSLVGGLVALPKFIGLPKVPFSVETLQIIFPTAIGIAIISILETLLASRVGCDGLGSQNAIAVSSTSAAVAGEYDNNEASAPQESTKTAASTMDYPNRLAIGLGIGNALSALFGGFGGCGLIPNTVLNASSGGKKALSSLGYSLFLALLVIAFSPLIASIPMTALAGLMFTVSLNTFEWAETKKVLQRARPGNRQGVLDFFAIVATMFLCLKVDMTVGVFTGVIVSQLDSILRNMRRYVRHNLQPKDPERPPQTAK